MIGQQAADSVLGVSYGSVGGRLQKGTNPIHKTI